MLKRGCETYLFQFLVYLSQPPKGFPAIEEFGLVVPDETNNSNTWDGKGLPAGYLGSQPTNLVGQRANEKRTARDTVIRPPDAGKKMRAYY